MFNSVLAHVLTGEVGNAAGLGAGTTEAVAVVTPMEVVKIRLQAQQHSLADPLEAPRYRNAGHAVYTIVREEGISTLYRGVSLTALRQATNQGALREPATTSLSVLIRLYQVPTLRRTRRSRNLRTECNLTSLSCHPISIW